MAFDANSAARDIVAAANEANATAMTVQGLEAPSAAAFSPASFCDLWKKAKPVLDVVSGVIIFIPGLGSTAGGVLKGLIKVGDQIAAQMCH